MKPVQFYILVALGAACLILSIVGMAVTKSNQHLQAELQGQQEEINRGNQSAQLRQNLVRDMAQAALDKKDSALKDVLSRAGFTVTQNPPHPATGGSDSSTPSSTSPNP